MCSCVGGKHNVNISSGQNVKCLKSGVQYDCLTLMISDISDISLIITFSLYFNSRTLNSELQICCTNLLYILYLCVE